MSTWVKAPGGVLPQKVDAYTSKEAAGPDGVDISGITSLDVAIVIGDKAFDDPVKVEQKRQAEAAAKAANDVVQQGEKAKKDARKLVLKDLSKIKDKDVQDVLKAIIEELGIS